MNLPDVRAFPWPAWKNSIYIDDPGGPLLILTFPSKTDIFHPVLTPWGRKEQRGNYIHLESYMNQVPQHRSLPHLRNRLSRLHRILSDPKTPSHRIRILDREAVVINRQIADIQNRLTDPHLQQALARGARIPGFYLIDSHGVEIT